MAEVDNVSGAILVVQVVLLCALIAAQVARSVLYFPMLYQGINVSPCGLFSSLL